MADVLKWFTDELKRATGLTIAVAGNNDYEVDVTGRPNFIYARLGGDDGDVVQVRCSIVHPNFGDTMLIEKEQPLGTAGWMMAFWLRDTNGSTDPGPIGGTIDVRHVLFDSDVVALTDSDGIVLESL